MARHRFDEVDDQLKWGGPSLVERWGREPSTHSLQEEETTFLEEPVEQELRHIFG